MALIEHWVMIASGVIGAVIAITLLVILIIVAIRRDLLR